MHYARRANKFQRSKLDRLNVRMVPTRFVMGERLMTKIKISSSELVWIFHQRLEEFDDCSRQAPIAIVPADEGWTALLSSKSRIQNPHWARRVEGIQKQLREIYVLRD